jgi:hypothetical protein
VLYQLSILHTVDFVLFQLGKSNGRYYCMSSIIFLQLTERNILVANAVLARVFLACKVNSLIVVVLTTEAFRSMDWLWENFRLIKRVVHIVGNVKTNNIVKCLWNINWKLRIFFLSLRRQHATKWPPNTRRMRNYSAASGYSAFAVIKVSTSKVLWLFERLRSIGTRLCPQESFLFNISIHYRKIGTFLRENLFFTQERKNSADRSRLSYT